MKNLQGKRTLPSKIKKTLDHQVESLDFPTRSRLKQARFYAIDHGLLNKRNSFFDWGRYAVAAAYVFGFTLLIAMNSFETTVLSNDETPYVLQQDREGINTLMATDDDTEEDIEIYNWLYERYG